MSGCTATRAMPRSWRTSAGRAGMTCASAEQSPATNCWRRSTPPTRQWSAGCRRRTGRPAPDRQSTKRKYSVADLRDAMRGIEYRDTEAFVDEIPASYKDIDQVMADAADLVEIRHTLRQIVNVKGD